jgi:Ca2+-binding EF-hand superfamily protein
MEELGESRKGTFLYGIIDSLRSKGKPINFEEFVEIVSPQVGDTKTKEGLRTVFRHMDTDGDDYITFDELKQLARFAGDGINDDEILDLMHAIHINHESKDHDGLYFEEFYTIITKFYKKS